MVFVALFLIATVAFVGLVFFISFLSIILLKLTYLLTFKNLVFKIRTKIIWSPILHLASIFQKHYFNFGSRHSVTKLVPNTYYILVFYNKLLKFFESKLLSIYVNLHLHTLEMK